MITQNLPLFTFIILLLILLLVQTSHAITNIPPQYCTPSACGNIHNISFPFRLEHDPKHCGNRYYELSCENNVTFVYLNPHVFNLNPQKYKVKAINYVNQTIWVQRDVSVNNNTCSFPNVPLNSFLFGYPYYRNDASWLISLMRCPYAYPMKNSPLFTELTTHCDQYPSNSSTHTYINVNSMTASDVGDNCSVDLVFLTSRHFKDLNNVSLSEIHHSLLYGFQLYWEPLDCILCNGRWHCRIGMGCGHDTNSLWGRIKYPLHGLKDQDYCQQLY